MSPSREHTHALLLSVQRLSTLAALQAGFAGCHTKDRKEKTMSPRWRCAEWREFERRIDLLSNATVRKRRCLSTRMPTQLKKERPQSACPSQRMRAVWLSNVSIPQHSTLCDCNIAPTGATTGSIYSPLPSSCIPNKLNRCRERCRMCVLR